jgi:DNA-binding transcriptional MerR regulator
MATDNLKDQMMTVSEVSRILHVHPNTLRCWSDNGVIKSYCITQRGDRRFLSKDIDQFLVEMNTQIQK